MAAAHVVAFVFSAVGENISLDTMKRPNEKDMTVIAENYLRTKHVRNSAQRFVRIETSYLLVRLSDEKNNMHCIVHSLADFYFTMHLP